MLLHYLFCFVLVSSSSSLCVHMCVLMFCLAMVCMLVSFCGKKYAQEYYHICRFFFFFD